MTHLGRPGLGLALLPLAVLLFERPASSDAPVGQYTLTTNTALDTRANLRWMRGFAGAGSAVMTWSEAAQACQSLTLDGYVGWRLPTTRELDSIYDWRRSTGPMWDATVFQPAMSVAGATLWSATEVVDDATRVEARNYFTRAYQVSSRDPREKVDVAGARCVRDP